MIGHWLSYRAFPKFSEMIISLQYWNKIVYIQHYFLFGILTVSFGMARLIYHINIRIAWQFPFTIGQINFWCEYYIIISLITFLMQTNANIYRLMYVWIAWWWRKIHSRTLYLIKEKGLVGYIYHGRNLRLKLSVTMDTVEIWNSILIMNVMSLKEQKEAYCQM